MPRILNDVKLGDWLTIVVNGVPELERVKRTSSSIIATEHYKLTRYGRVWPTHNPSIVVDRASKDEVERWLEKNPNRPQERTAKPKAISHSQRITLIIVN